MLCRYLRKALFVDMIHHYNLMIITGWRSPGAEEGVKSASLGCQRCGVSIYSMYELLPETARAWSHRRRSATLIPRNTFSAEVLGEEVQFIRRGLEGQLVQLLL